MLGCFGMVAHYITCKSPPGSPDLMREILKVRKVGGTLVVTLSQAILEETQLVEGQRVLVEALPPKRILISKEEKKMPTTRLVELELESLEAEKRAVDSDLEYKNLQYDQNMPCENGMMDSDVALLVLGELRRRRDAIGAQIAQKKLELFDLQGA